jgi:hypothetical protein
MTSSCPTTESTDPGIALAIDVTLDDARLQQGRREWQAGLCRGMLNQPELIHDVPVAQIRATAPVGRKAGARIAQLVSERFLQLERAN